MKNNCCEKCEIHLPHKESNEYQCSDAKCSCHTPMTHTTEERFKEKFCREDLGPEKRGQMLGWFLRDDITGKELLAFIEDEKRIVREGERGRRDGELIIMMHELDVGGWTLTRFLNTFCALYQKNYGQAPSQEDTKKQDNNN